MKHQVISISYAYISLRCGATDSLGRDMGFGQIALSWGHPARISPKILDLNLKGLGMEQKNFL
jgi:hypothetical protein